MKEQDNKIRKHYALVTANKAHVCNACKGTINKGALYVKLTSRNQKFVFSKRIYVNIIFCCSCAKSTPSYTKFKETCIADATAALLNPATNTRIQAQKIKNILQILQ